jgi:hypothetical protein
MASFEKEGSKNAPSDAVDATTDSGIAQLQGLGLPVKIMRT